MPRCDRVPFQAAFLGCDRSVGSAPCSRARPSPFVGYIIVALSADALDLERLREVLEAPFGAVERCALTMASRQLAPAYPLTIAG